MIAKLLSYSIVLLIIGVSSTATSSIGINCANSTTYGVDKRSNKNFLIVNLVSAILAIIIAFIGIAMAIPLF